MKFTMLVSISLTIAARLFFSLLFGLWLGLGVIGVAIGMSVDLVFRGAFFIWRLKSQRLAQSFRATWSPRIWSRRWS